MNRLLYRSCLPLFLLVMPMAAAAIGLGEVRGEPVMGERLRLEIDILGSERRPIEVSCFRLIPPGGADDLPWLKQAALSVRGGAVPVLEIRSPTALRDPILQLGVHLGCGYEISRQYVLLAEPAGGAEMAPAIVAGAETTTPPAGERPPRRVARPAPAVGDEPSPVRIAPRRTVSRPKPVDRLTLSGGGEAGELRLQLSAELASLNGGLSATEAQREMLRLEFRMLMVLNEQATTQLATAEKLRNMEALFGELQSRAGDFAARVEQGATAAAPAPAAAVVAAAVPKPAATPVLSEWSFYGLLLGLLLGLGGWFGWRSYSQRRTERPVGELSQPLAAAAVAAAPQPAVVYEAMDLSVEPKAASARTRVDVELDAGDEAAAGPVEEVPVLHAAPRDAATALEAATVDEHFAANPVMELADIMLSFGRVKGAAQALQEYIDSNPNEALQPWIRLMDVYRLAGMQGEFEQVARNLNQHFNVEVQHWDDAAAVGGLSLAGEAAVAATPFQAPRAETLEDMPRLMFMVCDLWTDGDVVGYLYQLLRDNRGGKRAGFALPVVEEILFLIELKETSNRIDKKEDMS